MNPASKAIMFGFSGKAVNLQKSEAISEFLANVLYYSFLHQSRRCKFVHDKKTWQRVLRKIFENVKVKKSFQFCSQLKDVSFSLLRRYNHFAAISFIFFSILTWSK